MRLSERHKLVAALRWVIHEGKHAVERNLMMTAFVIGLSAVSFAVASVNTFGRKDAVLQGGAAGKASGNKVQRMRLPLLDA